MAHKLNNGMLGLMLSLSCANSMAGQVANPYLSPPKMNMQQCVKQNNADCLKSICLASPDSCHSQCLANARAKCTLLTGQSL